MSDSLQPKEPVFRHETISRGKIVIEKRVVINGVVPPPGFKAYTAHFNDPQTGRNVGAINYEAESDDAAFDLIPEMTRNFMQGKAKQIILPGGPVRAS